MMSFCLIIIIYQNTSNWVFMASRNLSYLFFIGFKFKLLRNIQCILWESAISRVFFIKNPITCLNLFAEDLDDAVVPEEMVLLPAESAEVNYTVHLNKDRVDSLHKQNPSKEVLLANKLTVLSGCESTRLRLKRWANFSTA